MPFLRQQGRRHPKEPLRLPAGPIISTGRSALVEAELDDGVDQAVLAAEVG
jgi:hypothetical protein